MKEQIALTTSAIIDQFNSCFACSPQALVSSPGRVNLIGEYTDLNNGFVLPMAIDRYLLAAVKIRNDALVRVYSMDYKEHFDVSLEALEKRDNHWGNYISGCLWVLKEHGVPLKGFDCVIAGNIPVGAGLSSSAALELAFLRAACWTTGFPWDTRKMAELGQQVENRWIGVQSGIMDQLIISAGTANHALLIDCRDLSFEPCPMPGQATVVVLDTSTRRGLVDSEYNVRKEQCFAAAELLGVHSLREARLPFPENLQGKTSEAVIKRARHVITENERVRQAADSLKKGDLHRLGDLMIQSHISLRDDFEVTNDALNAMVECAIDHEACFGARMTGAGFGGCAVALVQNEGVHEFVNRVSQHYTDRTGNIPRLYACNASAGVDIETNLDESLRK